MGEGRSPGLWQLAVGSGLGPGSHEVGDGHAPGKKNPNTFLNRNIWKASKPTGVDANIPEIQVVGGNVDGHQVFDTSTPFKGKLLG